MKMYLKIEVHDKENVSVEYPTTTEERATLAGYIAAMMVNDITLSALLGTAVVNHAAKDAAYHKWLLTTIEFIKAWTPPDRNKKP